MYHVYLVNEEETEFTYVGTMTLEEARAIQNAAECGVDIIED